jgi:flagellar assembly factor FliW
MEYMKKKLDIGEIEFEEKDLLYFKFGIPGFENCKRYFIYTSEQWKPLLFLIGVDMEGLRLPLLDPFSFMIDYDPKIPIEDIEFLGGKEKKDVAVFVVATIPSTGMKDMYANMLAPILINPQTKLGMQVALEDDRYKLRQSVVESLRKSLEKMEKK